VATQLVLVRHGETEWSRDRRHTSTTDIGLTEKGCAAAAALADRLASWTFATTLVSPRRRARETVSIALPGANVTVNPDLAEWNYGDYEGLTSAQIHAERDPKWKLWRDGSPNGESPADVAARVDRVIASADGIEGIVACFAHAHVLRVLGARWVGLGPDAGAFFVLDTASISVLGLEHGRRVITRWNT
jgi:broad specificity phosphatase PhoE